MVPCALPLANPSAVLPLSLAIRLFFQYLAIHAERGITHRRTPPSPDTELDITRL
jgi:hypothetical protein